MNHSPIVVMKFGSSILSDVDSVPRAVHAIYRHVQQGERVIAVVSALEGETDRLLGMIDKLDTDADLYRVASFVGTGETKSALLLSIALERVGLTTQLLSPEGIGLIAEGYPLDSDPCKVNVGAVQKHLSACQVAVLPGFIACDMQGRTVLLGRGGSDTTAVALAAALQADVCEIFTDVEGVYTTDPNICTRARKIDKISYDEMLELASLGAKVLDIRSVTFAKKYNVPIHVRSTFTETEGTWVIEEDKEMEGRIVSGVTYNRDEARITISGVPDQPGIASKIFTPISDADIIVDMIIQNQDTGNGLTDMTFTVIRSDYQRTVQLLEGVIEKIGSNGGIHGSDAITKISIVGVGMRNHSGIASTMFNVLAKEGINISMISTSEIKVSCIIEDKYTELAIRALHDAFELDKDNVPEQESII